MARPCAGSGPICCCSRAEFNDMPDDLGTRLLNLQTADSQNPVIRQLGELLAGIPAPEGPSIVGGLRDTGLGLLNLMKFGREGGTLTPADTLSVPVAGGVAGVLGGPRGMALAAGAKRPGFVPPHLRGRVSPEEFQAGMRKGLDDPLGEPRRAPTSQSAQSQTPRAAAQAVSREPAPQSFVDEIMRVASTVKTPLFGTKQSRKTGQPTGAFPDSVAISDIFDAFVAKHPNIKISLDDFKSLVLRAQRNNQLQVKRADLQQLLARETFKRSTIKSGSDNFEFISLP